MRWRVERGGTPGAWLPGWFVRGTVFGGRVVHERVFDDWREAMTYAVGPLGDEEPCS